MASRASLTGLSAAQAALPQHSYSRQPFRELRSVARRSQKPFHTVSGPKMMQKEGRNVRLKHVLDCLRSFKHA